MAKPSFLAIIKNRVVVNWNKKSLTRSFISFLVGKFISKLMLGFDSHLEALSGLTFARL